MNDNIEDNDDFDIYADLDDNIDLNFGDSDNCLNFGDNYKKLSETDLPSILTNINETNDTNNYSINTTVTENTETLVITPEKLNIKSEDIDFKDESIDNKVSNDLILSEITILETNLNTTEDNNKSLLKLNEELREQLISKDKQLTVLKRNISSLYKTAKAEIDRKKQEIHDLRSELDSIIFRRLPRNGVKQEISEQTVVSQNDCKSNSDNVCHKSSQTSDRDLRNNSNNSKRSPDSSVKSPKQSNGQRTRRSRSKSVRRNGRSDSKSNKKIRRSRSKTPSRTLSFPKSAPKSRKSRSKSRQRSRRSRSKSIKRSNRRRSQSPRHKTNTTKDSKTSSKRKDEDNKRKSDKSDIKPQPDPKRHKSDKK